MPLSSTLSVLGQVYIVLTVCATSTRFSSDATGGNGHSRPRIPFPKPGAIPRDKISSDERQRHRHQHQHPPASGEPSPPTRGQCPLPPAPPKKTDQTTEARNVKQKGFQATKKPLSPHSPPSLQTGGTNPLLQTQPQAHGETNLVKELQAKFDGRAEKNINSPAPAEREVRTVKDDRRNEKDGVNVEEGGSGTSARDLKRFFEQGGSPTVRGRSTLPSSRKKSQNGKRTPKTHSNPDKGPRAFKEQTASTNANQVRLEQKPQPEIRNPGKPYHQAVSKSLKPLPPSPPRHISSSGPPAPIYENAGHGVSNACKNSHNSYAGSSRVHEGSTKGEPHVYENVETGALRVQERHRSPAAAAGEAYEEPIYEEPGDVSRRAVQFFQGHDQSSHETGEAPGRLFTRRGERPARHVPRGRSRSLSGWSMRALFDILSPWYLAFGFPLFVAGLTTGDSLLTLAGIALFVGGSVLNIVALLALWLRSVPPSDVIRMTPLNFELLFGIPAILSLSTFTVVSFQMTTFLAATVSAGEPIWIRATAPFCALGYVVQLGVLIYALYGVLTRRRQRPAADVEPGVSDGEQLEGEERPTFEMAYSPATAADNCHQGPEERPTFRERHRTLTRLFEYLHLHSYQIVLTALGGTLAAAVSTTQYATRRPDTPESLPYAIRHLRRMQLLPSVSSTVNVITDAPESLQATGYVGVLFVAIAIGNALLSCIASCARRITQQQSCLRRLDCGPGETLTIYLCIAGLTLLGTGFLAAFLEVSEVPDPSFARVFEFGTAMLGVLMALLPVFWTAFQSFGISFLTILHHFYPNDRPYRRSGGTSPENDIPYEKTSSPGQSQLLSEEGASRYMLAETAVESGSDTEWDTDED